MAAPVLAKSSAPNNWLSTSTSSATLVGDPAKNNQLSANASNVTLVGGGNDDTYVVYDSTVKLNDTGGVDTVLTWGSGYTLSSGIENLFLQGTQNSYATGNSGDNLLIGNAGNNKLTTGGGNDVLTGGAGADTFVISKAANTTSWITDLSTTTAGEAVNLTGYGFQGFATVKAAMTQVGTDVQITLGNGQYVMFENHAIADFTASNFVVEAAAPAGLPSSSTPPASGAAPALSGLKLTFNEDFNALSLNTGTSASAAGIWKTSDAWGNRTNPGTGQEQFYIDADYKGLGINPFSVNDGVLKIHAAQASAAVQSQIGGYDYTSGMITTATSFAQKYGYFEMRAQMAPGQGMWPAFWMMSAPPQLTWPPEIDIVEAIGGHNSNVLTSLHTGDGNSGRDNVVAADITAGFHTYALDWTASAITFYFDGQALYSRATPSDMNVPMYMLVNLGVGGTWPGSPDATTDWSKTDMYVDYVRVYSHDQNAQAFWNVTGQPPVNIVGTAGNESLSGTAWNDVIDGGAGNDTVSGGAGSDTLTGGVGNDLVLGGDGADTLSGGTGVDTLVGGNGDDTYRFGVTSGRVTVDNYDSDGGKDRILLNAGVSASNLKFVRLGDDLVMSINNTSDSLTVRNWFLGAAYQVDTILTATGAIVPVTVDSAASQVAGAPAGPLVATLSNGTDPTDLTSSFTTLYTGLNTSKIYTGSQMGVAGVDQWTQVTASYNLAGRLMVINNSAWNNIKDATVASSGSGAVTIKNFVDTEIRLGNGADTVVVEQAKRGNITTGYGDDSITVSAYSNGTTENVMNINAGDGRNTVSFTGASNTKTAITTGYGADQITIGGQAGATVDAGSGDDTLLVRSTGNVGLTGGLGCDVFDFIAGAHASITDFNAADDRIVLNGVSSSAVSVRAESGNTLIDLGGGSNITLAGVIVDRNALNIAYA